MKGRHEYKIKYSKLFFIIGIVFAAVISAITILGATINADGDHSIHIAIARAASYTTHPMYHLLLIWFERLFFIEMEYFSSFLLTISNIASILLLKKIIYYAISSYNNEISVANEISDINRFIIDFFCIASIFVMTIPSILTNNAMYIYQGYTGYDGIPFLPISSPNMWHNPTQLLLRPFQLISLYFFLRVIHNIKIPSNSIYYFKNLTMFSMFSVLATLAKPAGNFVIMPAFAIYAALILFGKLKERIIPALGLFVATLPIIATMLIQYQSAGIAGVGDYFIPLEMRFHFGTLANLSFEQVMFFAASNVLFALFIFITLGFKNMIKSPLYCIGIMTYFVGFFQFFFLTDGTWHFNMAWPYMFGSYIIMACSIIPLLTLEKSIKNMIIKVIGYSIYCIHFIFGLRYIILYLNTGTFIH